MPERFRLAVVLTHPVQYLAPWFRQIERECPALDLTVFYAVQPTPAAQAAGYGTPFTWDTDLLGGYRSRVLAASPSPASLLAESFSHVDAPELDEALTRWRPDAVLVPGWHAAFYARAMRRCRRLGVPTIYRGDSHLGTGPDGWRRHVWRVRTSRRLQAYSAWLAVGQRSRQYLAAFGAPEPLVFDAPHAVDGATFAEAADAARRTGAHLAFRHRHGLDPGAWVVTMVGRVSAIKRPLDVVRALASLRDQSVQLLVVGGGPLAGDVARAAASAGLRVAMAGFVNQSDLPAAYAASNCVVLASESETWGLVVNEALAAGVPCVVTERVGCAPDLIVPGETGAVVPVGDAAALARAVTDLRGRERAGHDVVSACRARASGFTFARATEGLLAAVTRLRRRADLRAANAFGAPRVIACCGNLVIAGGLERMTFHVLRVLRASGASVHVIVNRWESAPIVALAEQAGASWSTGAYMAVLTRRPTVAGAVHLVWDTAVTSAGLVRDAWRQRSTVVLVPEHAAVLRNWPGLLLLRLAGLDVVMRLGNAPDPGRFHRWMWRWVIGAVVQRFVGNSAFIAREVIACGIPEDRVQVVHNAAQVRPRQERPPAPVPGRVTFVGQIIPPKGLHVLLDAIALLRARGVEASLQVVGQMGGWVSPVYAGYRERLQARAAQADLRGHVTFLGFREDVVDLLADAWVHCCPSLPEQREGLAGVVLEAKQAGVPSVVTDTGSLPELVEHGVDGWVTRDASAEAVAEGLEVFLSDADRRQRAASAAAASCARFSPARFANGWRAVFGMPVDRA